LPPAPQAVLQTLTKAAIFLVATINSGEANCAAIRAFCGDLPGLLRAVGFRDIEGDLSCVMGIGSDAWDRLFGQPRPAELHPFREIKAGLREQSLLRVICCFTFARSAWTSVSSWQSK
jgi:putative iron-dependent peroxidase